MLNAQHTISAKPRLHQVPWTLKMERHLHAAAFMAMLRDMEVPQNAPYTEKTRLTRGEWQRRFMKAYTSLMAAAERDRDDAASLCRSLPTPYIAVNIERARIIKSKLTSAWRLIDEAARLRMDNRFPAELY